MNLEIELLKCYKCRDLNALLDRASSAFQMAGFPYLILKWEPTPGSDAAMIANSQPVWSNFTDRLGPSGVELTHGFFLKLFKKRIGIVETVRHISFAVNY